MRSKSTLVLVSVLLVVGLLMGLVACAKPAPTTPTTPTTPTAPAKPITIKVACNFATLWPLGLDALHMVEMDVDKINDAGGLDIGGQKVLFDIIFDDNKMDFALTKTAGQKEIHQDKVNFVLGDPWGLPLFQLCEDSATPAVITCYDIEFHDPKWTWVAGGNNGTTTYPAFIQYAAEKFPENKTIVGACPDRHGGRLTGEQQKHFAETAGLKTFPWIYYPPDATDLSAVGTKIKQLNPDMTCVMGGGPQLDAGILKAAYSAGWRGKVLGIATMPGSTIAAIAGDDAVEGGAYISWPAEFEPATTPEAVVYKADYIARYGKWDDPEPTIANVWYNLKGAIMTADSVDKTKVMAALWTPLETVCPMGTIVRFPRLDQGNTKCTDSITANLPVKTIESGKIRQTDTITVEMQKRYMKEVYGAPW